MKAPLPRVLALGVLALSPLAGSAHPRQADPHQDAQAELRQSLEKEGIVLDLEDHLLSLPATVLIKNELLEYLLVTPSGAMHESLFLTQVRPSLLNAALLLLGVEPGRNAHWEERGGLDAHGRPNKAIYPPEGDGFYLHAAWREAGETYFFRVEDLVRNLESGRSLRRHRWVYLGSRFAALRPGQPEIFVADAEGNLINLSFFFQGNTLLTAAPEECLAQTIWAANQWLVPEQGEPVRLFFARHPLEKLEPAWAATLPEAGVSGPESEAASGKGATEDSGAKR